MKVEKMKRTGCGEIFLLKYKKENIEQGTRNVEQGSRGASDHHSAFLVPCSLFGRSLFDIQKGLHYPTHR